jgi:hypothetical protein
MQGDWMEVKGVHSQGDESSQGFTITLPKKPFLRSIGLREHSQLVASMADLDRLDK